MATLVLIRHAKSDRPPGVADIERDLSERGTGDAGLVGKFLATALGSPGAVLTSPARRARRTAELVAAAAGWQVRPTVVERLYDGSVGALLAALAVAPGDPVVAFGHEPVWSAAVSTLIGGGNVTMVTAAAACLDGEPEPGGATLRWLVTPASLGGGPA